MSKSLFDVGVCIAFGVIGWLFMRFGFPVAPVVLGLVLGRITELNFRQAVMVGGYSSFFTRPLTVTLLIVSALAIILPVMQKRRARKKTERTDS